MSWSWPLALPLLAARVSPIKKRAAGTRPGAPSHLVATLPFFGAAAVSAEGREDALFEGLHDGCTCSGWNRRTDLVSLPRRAAYNDRPNLVNEALGYNVPVFQIAQAIPLPPFNYTTGAGGAAPENVSRPSVQTPRLR